MANERLTPLDASFLNIESETTHAHVACVMIFAGPAPSYEEFVEHLAARVGLVPRYRQRLAPVPLGQGRPVWADDENFDLRFHVRVTALPSPGTETELHVLAGRVFSQPVRRDRPLWEMWLVEGLSDGRFALLSKTHHSMVDGISGMDILSVLFAPEEVGEGGGERQAWKAAPAPSSVRLLADALIERTIMPNEMLRPLRAVGRRPRRLVERVFTTAVGAGTFARAGLSPAPPSPYNAPIGPDRRFTWVRASLGDLKAIKNALDATINDVVLAVVAGALRRHMLRRGESVEGVQLKAFVPVSVRAPDQHDGQGNLVSGMITQLPVGEEDPARRLRTIGQSMNQIKSSGQAVGASALLDLTGFAPPNLLAQATRLVTRQRFVNLVVTNVPGPQSALSMAGRELLDIFPMVPLGMNLALGVAIVSYNGTMNFGLVGDFRVLDDLDELAEDFTASLEELSRAAGLKRARSAPKASTPPKRSERSKRSKRSEAAASGKASPGKREVAA